MNLANGKEGDWNAGFEPSDYRNADVVSTLFEKIAKIKHWINNLTISDFEIVTGLLITGFNTTENRQKAEDIYKNKGLRTMTDLEINKLKSGDWFIIDSKLAKTKLCLVQKTKKSHKILCELAAKSNYNNFAWGYFAIPDRSYL